MSQRFETKCCKKALYKYSSFPFLSAGYIGLCKQACTQAYHSPNSKSTNNETIFTSLKKLNSMHRSHAKRIHNVDNALYPSGT